MFRETQEPLSYVRGSERGARLDTETRTLGSGLTRREWLWVAAGASLGHAAGAPTAPVAVARCRTYEPAELLPAMRKMFDQLGGLGRLVKGKTVAIKINLTGAPTYRLGYLPLEDTHYTHPHVIAAAAHQIGRAHV